MTNENTTISPNALHAAQAQKMYLYLLANAAICSPIPTKLACQRAIYYIYHVEVDGYNAKEDKDHWKQSKINEG